MDGLCFHDSDSLIRIGLVRVDACSEFDVGERGLEDHGLGWWGIVWDVLVAVGAG